MKKTLFLCSLLVLMLAYVPAAHAEEAAEPQIGISISDGSGTEKLVDRNYETALRLNAGTTITVTSEAGMNGLYVIWDSLVPEWELRVDGETVKCGQNGYLHEYIRLPEGSKEAVITVPDGSDVGTQSGTVQGGMRISDIYAFGAGSLPDWVQVWEPISDRADILFFSTHGDDEHIFFGGVLEYYGKELGLTVQVAYFTQHWVYDATSKIREHEKLNGLWYAGARNYPILGSFPDAYSTTLDGALSVISLTDAELYITQCIRRCKPQVVLTHDVNGEYGHGQHMLVSKATIGAVTYAADETYDTASVETYGTWTVPKFYIHLYGENKIHIDYRKPLESFDGMTALEVAKEAYKYHKSQQWCWFYVSDDYEYSISDWGLYSTTVGADVNCNDFMENLTSYAEQDRIEAERLAKEEAERLAAEEAARKAAEEEAARKAAEEAEEAERLAKEEAERQAEEERRAEELRAQERAEREAAAERAAAEAARARTTAIVTIVIGTLLCLCAAIGVAFILLRPKKRI